MRLYQIDFQRRVFAKGKESDQRFEMMVLIEDPITDTIADPMNEFNRAVDKYQWEFAKIVSGPTLLFEGIVHIQG